MRKIIFILIIAFLISATSYAKKPEADIPSVDAIESTYNSLNDFSAKFVQTTKVKLVDRTVTKKGAFRFKKGGKLRIEYEGIGGKNYVSDGKKLWVFIPGDAASLQTFAVSDETMPKEALPFLGGFGKLRQEFAIGRSTAFENAPEGTVALHLVPRARAKHYEYLDALFGPDHILTELIIQNTSGNQSRYLFSNIQTDKGIPDSVFLK